MADKWTFTVPEPRKFRHRVTITVEVNGDEYHIPIVVETAEPVVSVEIEEIE